MILKDIVKRSSWYQMKTTQGATEYMRILLDYIKGLEPEFGDYTSKHHIHFRENSSDDGKTVKYDPYIITRLDSPPIQDWDWNNLLSLEVIIGVNGKILTDSEIIVSLMFKKTKNRETPSTKEKETSGKIGELEWNFVDGVLSISGNGDIPDYDDFNNSQVTDDVHFPWYPFREIITKIVFKGSIKKTSLSAFSDCKNLSSVTFERNNDSYLHYIIDSAIQGFGRNDVENIKSWFLEIMPRLLRDFKRRAGGNISPVFSEDGTAESEWIAIIDRMIFCFSEAYECTCQMENEYSDMFYNRLVKGDVEYKCSIDDEELENKYTEREEQISEYRTAMQKEALKMFCETLNDLWY
jgi:hypothetical protein